MNDNYEQGFQDGEGSAQADLMILIDDLDIPFNTDDMHEFEVIRKMAEMIKAI
jgi:hypothetical protein